jgi:hypothetical protein
VISLNINTGFTGGNLIARGVSLSGGLSFSTYTISLRHTPATPTSITVRQTGYVGCAGDTMTYSVVMPSLSITQAPATSFRWTRPANTVIQSSNSDSSRIVLQFNSGFSGGVLSATSVTKCGITSAARTLTLAAPKTAPTPTNIVSATGNLYAGCASGTITYTTSSPTPSASQDAITVYRWTLPAGTQVSTANSDSSSVTVQFNAGFVGGTISVRGQTACGAIGTARTATLIRFGTPTPTNITSSTGNYAACSGNSINYTVVAPSPSTIQQAADVYRWTLPANASISSSNSDSSVVTIQFSTGFSGGSLSVRGQTNCGITGTARAVTLSSATCRESLPVTKNANTQPLSNDKRVRLYPNPNQGSFYIDVVTGNINQEKAIVSFINSNGRVVKQIQTQTFAGSIKQQFNLYDLANGIYLVKVETPTYKTTTKLMIQH